MDDMLEKSEYRHPEVFRFDERDEWYAVNTFLLDLARSAEEIQLKPDELVHIGGTANFYRTYQVFGPQAVPNFRGTHDMDMVSFSQGALRRVLDNLVLQYKEEQGILLNLRKFDLRKKKDGLETIKYGESEPRLHRVKGYSARPSLGLPDKRSIYIYLDYRDNPGVSSGFEVDLYESPSGKIRFNKRELTKEKLILDPPEQLVLPTLAKGKDRGLVSVPSLRDYLVIKTDIIDFSRSGLRDKDKFDILVTLRIASELNINYEELLLALKEANDEVSFKRKLNHMEKLLRNPFAELKAIPKNYPFFPTQNEVTQALSTTQAFKRKT